MYYLFSFSAKWECSLITCNWVSIKSRQIYESSAFPIWVWWGVVEGYGGALFVIYISSLRMPLLMLIFSGLKHSVVKFK